MYIYVQILKKTPCPPNVSPMQAPIQAKAAEEIQREGEEEEEEEEQSKTRTEEMNNDKKETNSNHLFRFQDIHILIQPPILAQKSFPNSPS